MSTDTIMSYTSQCVEYNQPTMPKLAIQQNAQPAGAGRSTGRFPGPPVKPSTTTASWAVIRRFSGPPPRPPGIDRNFGGPWAVFANRPPTAHQGGATWAVSSTAPSIARNGQRLFCSRTQLRVHSFSYFLPPHNQNLP